MTDDGRMTNNPGSAEVTAAIAGWMYAAGITVGQLAARTGLRARRLRALLVGRRRWTVDEASLCCDALGLEFPGRPYKKGHDD